MEVFRKIIAGLFAGIIFVITLPFRIIFLILVTIFDIFIGIISFIGKIFE
jgi:hypothetical protein